MVSLSEWAWLQQELRTLWDMNEGDYHENFGYISDVVIDPDGIRSYHITPNFDLTGRVPFIVTYHKLDLSDSDTFVLKITDEDGKAFGRYTSKIHKVFEPFMK